MIVSYLLIVIIALIAFICLGILCRITIHLSSMVFGAPYVPSRDENIKKILTLSSSTGRVADLGSGDGRVLIELAEQYDEVHGYEINPVMFRQSKKKIAQAGMKEKIQVYNGSFFKYDLSSYDMIYIYGISYIMRRLENKLQHELRSGSEVVTCGFHFPTWKPIKKDGSVWLYRKM